MSDGYQRAAVCRRGHTIDPAIELSGERPPNKCSACGATVLTACAHCGTTIQGFYVVEGIVDFGARYSPPAFCFSCGGPFPWADRQALLWELENRLDEDPDLTPAERLTIHEQLEALRSGRLTEAQQNERWARINEAAPGALAKAGKLVEVVGTAWVMKKLGLA